MQIEIQSMESEAQADSDLLHRNDQRKLEARDRRLPNTHFQQLASARQNHYQITSDNAVACYNGTSERQRSAATRYTSPAAQIALDPTRVVQRRIHSGSAALLR